jgi:L-ascorbate metabolism protein UlaG (beta-lactamase superfamily)
MKIKYVHHSGFIVEDNTCTIMIDCCGLTKKHAKFRDANEAVDAVRPLYILASHVHGDHFDPNILSFGGPRTKCILSADIRGRVPQRKDIVFLAKGDVYRDETVTIKAYGSTDEGVSFYIEAGGRKLFHAGDLNNWHWNEEETPQDAAKNERFFLEELALIAREVPALDAAMFPVDPRLGKDYTRGAEQFLDSVKTGLFIPMHFWDKTEAARAFKPAAELRGCRFADIRGANEVGEDDVFEI